MCAQRVQSPEFKEPLWVRSPCCRSQRRQSRHSPSGTSASYATGGKKWDGLPHLIHPSLSLGSISDVSCEPLASTPGATSSFCPLVTIAFVERWLSRRRTAFQLSQTPVCLCWVSGDGRRAQRQTERERDGGEDKPVLTCLCHSEHTAVRSWMVRLWHVVVV